VWCGGEIARLNIGRANKIGSREVVSMVNASTHQKLLGPEAGRLRRKGRRNGSRKGTFSQATYLVMK